MVVSCVALGLAGSLLYVKSVERIYQAESLIEMNARAPQLLNDASPQTFDMSALFVDPNEFYQTQFRILTSLPVMEAAVDAASLTTDYQFFGLKQAPEKPITVEQAALALSGRVAVEGIKGSRLAYVRVKDSDPKRARRLCDAVVAAYLEQNLDAGVNSSSDAVTWLSTQIEHIKGDLDHDEDMLDEFKQKNELPSISINDSSNMLRVEMQEYDVALTHTRTRKAELVARRAELAEVTSENPDAESSSELLANPALQSLRAQYRSAVELRDELIAGGKGPNHPMMKEADAKIESTRAALLTEVANVQAAVVRDLAVIQRQEQAEAGMFDVSRRNAIDLNMKEIQYHRLDRSRQENEKFFELLTQRLKEADLTRMMRMNNLRVVEKARLPGSPVSPKVWLDVLIGILGGLLAGLGLPLLREQLDNSVKTPDDIEEKLGITCLGLLPDIRREDNGGGVRRARRRRRLLDSGPDGPSELVVHHRPTSGLAEAARSVRTNLMFMNPDKPCKVILVTSAAPSEGKTTVACSVAIALAQGGQRVCILDADLRRPRLHRIFDRVGDVGFTNALVHDASLDEVSKPTLVPNLWCIPAGPLPPNAADLLHSERFRRFIQGLRERYDRIVIDSPPLVAVTDSAIISTVVDGTVFVVRAFQTGKHVSARGLRALQDVEAPITGAVLNAVNLNRQEYGYSQYYYYKKHGYATIPATAAEHGAGASAD
jgi:capsular exopolysaccharide synthesis family protein